MRGLKSPALAVVVVAAVTSLTSTARAGDDPFAAVERPAGTSFVLAPAILFTDVGADTNILVSPTDPKRDFTANLTMQVEPLKQLGLATIRGKGAVTLAYFQQYANQRSADPHGDVRFDLRLNRVTVYAAGSALRTRDPYGPEIDVRVQRAEAALQGGAEVRIGEKTWIAAGAGGARLAFNASEMLYDSSLQRALDHTSATASLAARHEVTPLTTIVALADVQRDRFPFSPLRDDNGIRLVGGFEFRPTALVAGKAQVGYRRFISRDSIQPDVAGAVASVDLTYTLADTVRFGVRVERDLAPSYSMTERYFMSTDVRFVVTRRVNRALDITGTVGRGRLDYTGAIAPTSAPQPTDHLLGLGGGLAYRVGNATAIGVNVDYYRRESELTGTEYDRLRLVSSFGYRF